MEFKGRDARAKCYEARDIFFDCIDKFSDADKDAKSSCKEVYENFERNCGVKWTEHFIRKRDYIKFKERLYEEGVDAADEKKYKK